jgi:hypothetical protein
MVDHHVQVPFTQLPRAQFCTSDRPMAATETTERDDRLAAVHECGLTVREDLRKHVRPPLRRPPVVLDVVGYELLNDGVSAVKMAELCVWVQQVLTVPQPVDVQNRRLASYSER